MAKAARSALPVTRGASSVGGPGPLRGARIALTGARKAQETAEFVTRLGGIPIIAPSLSTTTVDADPAVGSERADSPAEVTDPFQHAAIERILREDIALFIFLTAVGARTLLRVADAASKTEAIRSKLGNAAVVVRGPKALGALKGAGLHVDWMPREATVEAIKAGLDRFEVTGRSAVVQLSGFADDRLRHELERRGASVIELDLYHHDAPANEAPIVDLIDQIDAATIDFLTFTSAVGVREFFAVAERHERDEDLLAALRREKTVLVAVGPVTAAALTDAGAPATIIPSTHTTGGMLRAIGDWIASHPR